MKFTKGLATLFIIFVLFLGGFGVAALALSPGGHASAAVNPAASTGAAPASNIPVANSSNLQSSPSTITASPNMAAMQSTLEQIYNQVSPSVVYIDVLTSGTSSSSLQLPPGHPFVSPAQQAPSEAQGSGFVWNTQGDIVTNNHVVAGASKITVTFPDGTTADATVVGTDPKSDLAVIKVNVPAAQLHPVTLADSSQVKVGQVAIAIGNPFGLSGTMTQGIISGLSRSLPVDTSSNNSTSQGAVYNIPDIIQTDAAINPGNSGGVLLNTDGQVIGITAAIRSPVDANSGIGFVIPSNIVQREVPVLIQTGHYDHPYLGISGTDLTYDLATAMNLPSTQKGALVISVSPNGPAAAAGLQGSNNQVTINGQPEVVGGDVITAINGQTINSFEDLASYLLNNTQVGQTVNLTILRQGQQKTVQLTLGAMPQ